MTLAKTQTLTLEEFLKLPNLEQSPAWEYVDGEAAQKPMPKVDTLCCKSGYSLN